MKMKSMTCLKGRIWIRMKMKSMTCLKGRIWIRMKIKGRFWIRIGTKVTRIRNTGHAALIF